MLLNDARKYGRIIVPVYDLNLDIDVRGQAASSLVSGRHIQQARLHLLVVKRSKTDNDYS